MPFDDLQKAVAYFEKRDRLVRISEPIDPKLEITEVSDRVVKAAGPALLFDKPTGYDIPVLTNLYGTADRVETIFGLEDLDQIGRRLIDLLDLEPPRGWLDKLKLLPKLKDAAALFPKKVTDAPCQEVVKTDTADLNELPVLTCWPGDGGPFITLPVVVTNHPVTGKRNVGMYRVQVFDAKTAGMHWHIHKGGADHYRQINDGRPFPVAVALGPDPITTYCATAPVPDGIDEMIFSGFLRRKPVEMVKCVTCDLEVPAQSQIVLEGYVPARRVADRGALRRPHRILFPGRSIPGFPPRGDHQSPPADLSGHGSWVSAHGRRMAGQTDRTSLPSPAATATARDRGHESAHGRLLPQPGFRVHRQNATPATPGRSCTPCGAWAR